MWRVVFDTSVIVAALLSNHGASAALIGLVADRAVVPLVTMALFLEYEDVLKRPEHLTVMHKDIDWVDGFLAAFASAAEGVDIHFRWRPQTRDPGDEMVLEAAMNGRADALVTHNLRDFAGVDAGLGLTVWTPGEALRRIRS
jgi:putative PIN family toxin of toxin-antitoxin system